MTASYYLSKLDTDDDQGLWTLITSAQGEVSARQGDVVSFISTLQTSPVTVLIDAAEIRTIKAKVPGRSEAQVRQAAPYVIEEDLANDVDDLMITVSQADDDGYRFITIYDQEVIETICQQLKSAGVNVAAVMPDAALIDAGERDCVAVILGDDRARLSYQDGLCAAVDYDVLPAFLVRLIRDQKIAQAFITITPNANLPKDFQQHVSDILHAAHPHVALQFVDTKTSALCHAVAQQKHKDTQRDFSKLMPESMREDGSFGLARSRLYLIAAAFAACALAAHIAFSWLSNKDKAAELAFFKAQQQEIFSVAFPEVKRVVNAEAQAQQRVKELKEKGPPPAAFLNVLYTSARLMRDNGSGIQLTGFSYADGVLLLRTESGDMAMLEKYRGELSHLLSAEVVNAESGDNMVRGAIRVRGKQ